ncbi:MAG: hypothetical protein CMJ48_12170 [Planctomycetaceae bacterium]|nr:hypothetical protein [Planctomycetaceae bacterium]
MNRHLSRCLTTLLVLAIGTATFAADGKKAKSISLFDGKSLKGWHGDTQLWSVEDGAILGQTDGQIPHNTFLISDKEYSNFVLKVKFRLHNHKGNSGIQYRSSESKDFVVGGYQADVADNHFMGILYGERTGRGIIVNTTDDVKSKLAKAVKKDGWNEFTITADGNHLTQVLNGVTTVDFVDKDAKALSSGIIALQLHKGQDMKISFKDITLTPLPAK